MNNTTYWKSPRPVSRRRVLAGMGAGAVSLGLTAGGIACGGDDDDAADVPGSPTLGGNPTAVATPTGQPKTGGTVRLAYSGSNFSHLDLHRIVDATLPQLATFTSNRLVRHKTDPSVPPTAYTIEADAAESWEQPDDSGSITFKLRPGIKWHNKAPLNGRELTADDVVRSFERQRSEGAEYVYSYLFGWVDSITATDDHTVVFKAKELNYRALPGLALREVPILSADAAEHFGNLESPEAWAGIGPFILDEWRQGVGFKLSRNPDYWEPGHPYVDSVDWKDIPDPSSQFAAFVAGEIDQIENYAQELEGTLKGSLPNARTSRFSSVGGSSYAWSVKDPASPFHDPRVLKAWSLIVDPIQLADALYGGEADIRVGPLSPGFTDYARSQDEIRAEAIFDPQQARALLAEAGFADGIKTNIMAASTNGPWLEWAVRQGALAGFEITPQAVEGAIWRAAQRDHNFDYGNVYGIRAYDDPDEYLYPLFYSGASKNYYEISDPELDRLILKQRQVTEFEERKQVLQEIDKRWRDDFNHHTFATTLYRNDAISGRLQNHQVRVVNEYSQIRYAWIDETKA